MQKKMWGVLFGVLFALTSCLSVWAEEGSTQKPPCEKCQKMQGAKKECDQCAKMKAAGKKCDCKKCECAKKGGKDCGCGKKKAAGKKCDCKECGCAKKDGKDCGCGKKKGGMNCDECAKMKDGKNCEKCAKMKDAEAKPAPEGAAAAKGAEKPCCDKDKTKK